VVGGLTAWSRRSNRPGQSEQVFAFCCIPVLNCCICSGGVCFGSGGACICAGELFVVFEFLFSDLRSLFEHDFVSDVSSHCPCLRGPRLVFFGFRSLVEVSFYLFLFFFPFLLCYFMSVLSMHSSRGRLRTMCGSRTGGWSLPCVISD
jgi:hypothetical protein